MYGEELCKDTLTEHVQEFARNVGTLRKSKGDAILITYHCAWR